MHSALKSFGTVRSEGRIQGQTEEEGEGVRGKRMTNGKCGSIFNLWSERSTWVAVVESIQDNLFLVISIRNNLVLPSLRPIAGSMTLWKHLL